MPRDIRTIRRLRVMHLIREQFDGNQTRFAERVGQSQAAINHILTGEKGLGEKRARAFEQQLGLERYFFDREHNPAGEMIRDPFLSPTLPVPLLSWVEVASGKELVRKSEREQWPGPPGSSEATFALRVEGDVLEPEFSDREVLYVDPTVTPQSGAYVIVQMQSSEVICRQYLVEAGREFLRHPNPSWPDRVVPISGAKIIGVVIAQMKDRR